MGPSGLLVVQQTLLPLHSQLEQLTLLALEVSGWIPGVLGVPHAPPKDKQGIVFSKLNQNIQKHPSAAVTPYLEIIACTAREEVGEEIFGCLFLSLPI